MSGGAFGWGNGGGGGGSVATGVLQLENGVPMDETSRIVTDQAGTASPLQLSQTELLIADSTITKGFLFRPWTDVTTSLALYASNLTPSNTNYALLLDGNTTYLNAATTLRIGVAGGTSAYLQMSSTSTIISQNTVIGHTTASARLHVRGDGSNPIQAWENLAGTLSWFIKSDATMLQMGGVTNAYPAIKQNGAAINFRLADDTDYAAVTSRSIRVRSEADQYSYVDLNAVGGNSFATFGNGNGNTGEIRFNASEIFVINRTVDATAYKVGGTAGVASFTGAVTSITVVNGLITAIS